MGLKFGWGWASGNRQGGTNSVRLMEPQIWYPPAGCMALWGGEDSEKEQWPPPASLSRRILPLRSHPEAKQLISSLYVSDALQSAVPILELTGSKSK